MIVFCEAELVNRPALLGQSQQAANARIHAGDVLPDAMSTTWLHELIHIWTVSPPGKEFPPHLMTSTQSIV